LQELLQLRNIEADYDVAINHGYWRCHIAELFQFLKCCLIRCNVPIGELDLVL